MKIIKYYLICLLVVFSLQLSSQTVTVTIIYSGAQAWGCCSVCGNDYMCIGTSGCGCCQSSQQTKTFMDPVPPGNMVVGMTVTYFAADCSAPNVPTDINGCHEGTAVNTVGNNTCACGSCNPVWFYTAHPTGMTNYNYGAMNTLFADPPLGTEICTQRVEIQIDYAPGTPPSGLVTPGPITGTNPVCPGQTFTYSIPAVPGATTYTWTVPSGSVINSGQGTTTITVTFGSNTGNLCVTASNTCLTSTQFCIPITFASAPPAPGPITGPTTVCQGSTQTYSITAIPGVTSYDWTVPAGAVITSGQGTTTITVTFGASAGNISVTATNACGTSAATNLAVALYPLISITLSSNDLIICSGESTVIGGTATGGDGGPYTYTWDNGLGVATPPITVSPVTTTTYNVSVTDACGSPVGTGSITITVSPTPTINFSALPIQGCAPLDVNFTSNCTPAIQSYLWDFGDPGSGTNTSVQTNPSHQYQTPGTYDVTLTATSTDGCVNNATVTGMVTSAPKPTADFTPNPSSTTMDNPTVNFIDNSTNTSTWTWNFGDPASPSGNASSDQSPSHTYSNQGTYVVWLVVESSVGCKDSISKDVEIKDDFTYFAADAFTPDGDGLNDYFVPTGVNIDINNFDMHIYDRWGEELYRTKDMSKPWNGNKNNMNEKAKPGVYVWMTKITDNKGKGHVIYGRVTLIR